MTNSPRGLESNSGILEAEVCFAIPVAGQYYRMARALGNSVRHFHPRSKLVAMTVPGPGSEITALVDDGPFEELLIFDETRLSDEGYSPVIWTKLQVIGLDLAKVLVILDADLIMYRRVDALIDQFLMSGKRIAATLDDDPSLATALKRPGVLGNDVADVPALSGCLVMTRPDPAVSEHLLDLARVLNGESYWPEQAVFSWFASQHGGWVDLGIGAVVQCWDEGVLKNPVEAVFVHVGAPRPATFGASPRRWGEPGLIDAVDRFLERWGRPFPAERLSADFTQRVSDEW